MKITNEKGVVKMKKIEEKILSIFKSKTCNRKDYWCFFGISLLIYVVLINIGKIIQSNYVYFNYPFYEHFFLSVFIFLVIYFQIKRLRDANMSPYFLLVYALFIFGIPAFNYIVYIVLLILLLLPSQRIPTTNIYKEEK